MANETTARRKLPGSLDTNRSLATWPSINRDGTVDMRPGEIEIGQGILSALFAEAPREDRSLRRKNNPNTAAGGKTLEAEYSRHFLTHAAPSCAVVADAALLARAVASRPVRVQWMREEEFMWEPFAPAMVMKTRATLGKDGNVASWHFNIWSHGHSSRPIPGRVAICCRRGISKSP